MGACSHDARPTDWDVVLHAIRRDYPEVRQLSTQALSAWLQDSHRTAPLLLDVRSSEEYMLSHLPKARHAPENADWKVFLQRISEDAPIVVYCSVGHRSAKAAQQLQQAGFQQVHNLEGSIFAWANEHRPLVRDGHTVHEVHPYDVTWGRLLNHSYHPTQDSM